MQNVSNRLLVVTPIMLINLGKLTPALEPLTVQSNPLLHLIILELILVSSCAKILNSMELLVWLGLEQCAKPIGPGITLESMKKDKMSWQLLR